MLGAGKMGRGEIGKSLIPCGFSSLLAASLDGYSGNVKRAPEFFIKMNLEWFYRLIGQPSRLGRMMKLPKFVFGTIIYKLSGKAKKKS